MQMSPLSCGIRIIAMALGEGYNVAVRLSMLSSDVLDYYVEVLVATSSLLVRCSLS